MRVSFKKLHWGYEASAIAAGQPGRQIASIVKAASGVTNCYDIFWVTGRVDRDYTLQEAKDSCQKSSDVAVQISKVGCSPDAAWWAQVWRDARAAAGTEAGDKLGLVGVDLAKRIAMFQITGCSRWLPIAIAP